LVLSERLRRHTSPGVTKTFVVSLMGEKHQKKPYWESPYTDIWGGGGVGTKGDFRNYQVARTPQVTPHTKLEKGKDRSKKKESSLNSRDSTD